jgi:hypothetical protein
MIPFRMNLLPLKIRQLEEEVELDPDFLEPLSNKSYSEPKEIKAQIVFASYQEKTPSLTGDIERTDGRICVRIRDLERLGIVLKKGDRIVAVKEDGTWKEVDFVINHIKPAGHLPQAHILLAYFIHRQEKRESA